MNSNMLAHPSVQRNIARLAQRGVHFVEPGEGYLACGWTGKGRLAEPAEIVAASRQLLRPDGRLAGRSVLVTAGPTCEDLDVVRYLSNRSTGRMGSRWRPRRSPAARACSSWRDRRRSSRPRGRR